MALKLNFLSQSSVFHYNYIVQGLKHQPKKITEPWFTQNILFRSLNLDHYYHMAQGEQRQNIVGLPLQERVIAVALKHVFDQIKKIQQEEEKELATVNHSYNKSFKSLQQKASQIIKGKSSSKSYLQADHRLLTQVQKKQAQLISSSPQPINKYWLTALINFYGQDLTEADRQIAQALTDISTNISQDSIEVTFDLGPNQWISSSILTKRYLIEEGIVAQVIGDNANWLKPKANGIFSIILCENQSCSVGEAFTFANQIVNEVVPYSLRYYLGATETEEYQCQQGQQGEEWIDIQPVKKIKE